MTDIWTYVSGIVSTLQSLEGAARPTLTQLAVGAGAVVTAVVTYVGRVYWLRDRSLRLKTTKLKWLRQSLLSGKHVKCPELLRELEFQIAYGYRYNGDEIAFATARFNPSQMLHDIRYGNLHIKFNEAKTAYVERSLSKGTFLSPTMGRRAQIVGVVMFALWLLFVLGMFGLLFSPLGGGLLMMLSLGGFLMLFDSYRGLKCAIRLCALTPDSIRPKDKKKPRRPNGVATSSQAPAAGESL